MPSKVYEALASGTPPIVAKGCQAEELVIPEQAGCAYEPGDENELAEAICKLADDKEYRSKCRNNAIELSKRFDRDLLAQRTETIMISTAQAKPLPEIEW